MIDESKKREYYKALLERDKKYEGTFYVGVMTTGVFCHSTCPARKPKFKNCEFFQTANEALLMGYRPCKKCNPLSKPNELPDKVKKLIDELSKNENKKFEKEDFERLGISSSYARRQFKKYFNMTFVQYSRALRLSQGLKVIKNGFRIIDGQLESHYNSDSGFRSAVKSTFGYELSRQKEYIELYSTIIPTVLGNMLAISNENALILLEFIDRKGLETELKKLNEKFNAVIIPKETKVLKQTKKQLDDYFDGVSMEFNIPLELFGSVFNKQVWGELRKIEYGKTMSYLQIAKKLSSPTKSRAVGRANGLNQIAIIIPCHRVIKSDGSISGYGGGVERKVWLLEHERKNKGGNNDDI